MPAVQGFLVVTAALISTALATENQNQSLTQGQYGESWKMDFQPRRGRSSKNLGNSRSLDQIFYSRTQDYGQENTQMKSQTLNYGIPQNSESAQGTGLTFNSGFKQNSWLPNTDVAQSVQSRAINSPQPRNSREFVSFDDASAGIPRQYNVEPLVNPRHYVNYEAAQNTGIASNSNTPRNSHLTPISKSVQNSDQSLNFGNLKDSIQPVSSDIRSGTQGNSDYSQHHRRRLNTGGPGNSRQPANFNRPPQSGENSNSRYLSSSRLEPLNSGISQTDEQPMNSPPLDYSRSMNVYHSQNDDQPFNSYQPHKFRQPTSSDFLKNSGQLLNHSPVQSSRQENASFSQHFQKPVNSTPLRNARPPANPENPQHFRQPFYSNVPRNSDQTFSSIPVQNSGQGNTSFTLHSQQSVNLDGLRNFRPLLNPDNPQNVRQPHNSDILTNVGSSFSSSSVQTSSQGDASYTQNSRQPIDKDYLRNYRQFINSDQQQSSRQPVHDIGFTGSEQTRRNRQPVGSRLSRQS